MSTKVRRILVPVLSILVILGLLAGLLPGVIIPSLAKRSFPQTSGELQLSELNAPVQIYRDGMGIAHIYASTRHDLFFAQGYVHAQERFWQMDFWRHIGSARLSEMFGKSQLKTDSFLRTLGWRQLAEQEYAMLSPESKALLDDYAAGVNAYLQGRQPVEVSLEYAILTGLLNRSYQIEPWTPVHSLTWAKAMAWDLRGNMGAEIERAILLKTFSPQQVDELFPPYPGDHPTIVGDTSADSGQATPAASLPVSPAESAALEQAAANLQALNPVLGKGGAGIGSNSWVIGGDRTVSGKPLLANDPHLGIQMPSIWFQIGLHCAPKTADCPYEVAGFSFAGVPGVVIGHNERIAWGFTNLGPDVMDLYVEKLNPDNPNQYEVNGQWVDMTLREETIQVAGAKPVTITVRSTRHGPLISDTYGPLLDTLEPESSATPFKDRAGIDLPAQYAIALRWTALDANPIFEAIWGFDKAANWDEFRQAARYFTVPAQNLVYADVDGNIGYQTPGAIPIRAKGNGQAPVPGWTDDYEWQGFIPFEELPSVFNPAEGYIVTANNQASPRDYPYLITTDWDYGFRARRIVDMVLQAPGPIDAAYIQTMQGDSKSLNAETLVPLLLQVNLPAEQAAIRDQYFKNWDYQEKMDSPSAALFETFYWDLIGATFYDEPFPEDYLPSGGSRFYEVMRNLVKQPDSAWWDDVSTPDVKENRDDMLAKAFAQALKCDICIQKFGKDIANWRWGELHSATFRNATLGKSGIGLIENMFNRGPYPTSGGESLVNATGWDVGDSFEVNWLPSMRMIVDLSALDASQTVHTTGQSGHAYAPHYVDMADLWRNLQYYPMWWEQSSIEKNAESLLTLRP